MALGPFTKKMVELCKSEGPKDIDCDAVQLPAESALKWRGTEVCPAGAVALPNGFCAEGNEIYGPFVHERVDVCKEYRGGPACESNRWSIVFANSTTKVPDPVVDPQAPGEEAFDRYIAAAVYRILREDKNLGYANRAEAQHSRDLFYNDSKIFAAGTRASHCVGMTFQVLVMAMNQYFSDTKDSRVWSMTPAAMKWEPFKNCWYVNTAGGKRCYGARDAIVRYGLGVAVQNFSDLKIGDFVNYDRTSGYGHSTVFMGFLLPDGTKTFTYNSSVVGFEYFSTQGATQGAGLMKAYFSGEKCPSQFDCGILKNSLVMGRVLHPSKFKKQAQMFAMALSETESALEVPTRYLLGNETWQ